MNHFLLGRLRDHFGCALILYWILTCFSDSLLDPALSTYARSSHCLHSNSTSSAHHLCVLLVSGPPTQKQRSGFPLGHLEHRQAIRQGGVVSQAAVTDLVPSAMAGLALSRVAAAPWCQLQAGKDETPPGSQALLFAYRKGIWSWSKKMKCCGVLAGDSWFPFSKRWAQEWFGAASGENSGFQDCWEYHRLFFLFLCLCVLLCLCFFGGTLYVSLLVCGCYLTTSKLMFPL